VQFRIMAYQPSIVTANNEVRVSKALLPSSSIEEIARLLDLFPVSSVREYWPKLSGHKGDLIRLVAENQPHEDIIEFVQEHIAYCKQHIYFYAHEGGFAKSPNLNLPGTVLASSWKEQPWQKHLFLTRYHYTVVLRENVTVIEIPFIWPFTIEYTAEYLIVRFVIMEKSVSSYLDGKSFFKAEKSIEEDGILNAIIGVSEGDEVPKMLDFNKGIKHLWETDVVDAKRVRFLTGISSSLEVMNKGKLVKKHFRKQYNEAMKCPLLKSHFITNKADGIVDLDFTADPNNGFVGFGKFLDGKGDAEYVVREILRHNK
jgi:hypothetical protein